VNENTLITVHGYAGDAHQIEAFMPWYLHHEAPVIVMSPYDAYISKINAAPTVITRSGGFKGYIGQASLDRQRIHLEIALEHKFGFYLLNDSDSLCLSPEIPKYLYEESNFFWSNEVGEPRPHASPYPKIAMQPPYFVSHANLEKMVAVAPKISAHHITPYIDWYMLALVCEAGIEHRSFWDKEVDHGTRHPTEEIKQDPWNEMYDRVRNHGRVMVHPIKTLACAQRLAQERNIYTSTYER
jgi:hypothetical protein